MTVAPPLMPPRELRDSGIEVIGHVPWGTHFCQFYGSADDLSAVVVPYLKAGLDANEFCMWITSDPLTGSEAEARLREAVPDLDDRMRDGAIAILPYTEWTVIGGVFEAERVLDAWVAMERQALDRGFAGLRVSGNAAWLESADWDDFEAYEGMINAVISNYRMMALCTYPLEACGAAEVLGVVQNHQFAVAKRRGEWAQIEDSQRKRALAEVERLNADLERRARQLEATNRELEAFSASVTHDVRAPLRAVTGFTRELQQTHAHALPDGASRLVERIAAASLRMNGLLDALVELSRLSRHELHTRDVDVSAAGRTIASTLRGRDPDRRVEFAIEDGLVTRGDLELVRVLLDQLLGNAWKATAGREGARIELFAEDCGGCRAFVVRDNGIGFDMRYADRLFAPFQRLHPDAAFPGAGVGLAEAQRIVHRHGGTIAGEGRPGEGATFRFDLGDC